MKKFLFASMIAMTAMAGAAHAEVGGAMTPKTVNYSCQRGKSINVTYYFNKQGLPTKAVSKLNGAKRTMPTNLNLSDSTGTTFGKSRTYMIGTDAMDSTNYNQLTLSTVTSPSNRIIYKECSPN